MANRTDSGAVSVHGTNPQYLIEKIVRLKIHASAYWKEHCYALTAETLVDKAVELEYIGGTYGGSRKPAPFLCLALKMLQLQPELEIVYEFIKNEDYKYVTALGCFYLRLIGRAEEIYNYLEPRYNDYRKLRFRETDGKYKIIHVDEFVEELLTREAYCDTILPHMLKRQVLEDQGTLQPRHSALEDQDDDDDEEALLAEIQADKEKANGEITGVVAGENELIENPRAAALKPDRESEERGRRSPSRDSEEEARRKEEKRKRKKEKKKKKYRTRGSESRSRSRSEHRRDRSRSESGSRSRSRSKDRKKKKSWKKALKEKRRDRKRDDSRDRSKSRSRDRDRERKKDRKEDRKREEENDSKPDENSDEYWLALRAKLGLKPM